jgi:hypothetical protein
VAPATGDIEKILPVELVGINAGAAVNTGAVGIVERVILSELVPLCPQLLVAKTLTTPEVVAILTVMDVVPCPAVMVAPGGTDQV